MRLISFAAQLADIVGNEPIVERLKIIGEEGNMNNMILAVSPRPAPMHATLVLENGYLWCGRARWGAALSRAAL